MYTYICIYFYMYIYIYNNESNYLHKHTFCVLICFWLTTINVLVNSRDSFETHLSIVQFYLLFYVYVLIK